MEGLLLVAVAKRRFGCRARRADLSPFVSQTETVSPAAMVARLGAVVLAALASGSAQASAARKAPVASVASVARAVRRVRRMRGLLPAVVRGEGSGGGRWR